MKTRIVSRLALVIPRLWASSAISRTAHRARPSGAGPHTIAIKCASSFGWIARSRPGREGSSIAPFIPFSRYRSATLRTPIPVIPTASAASSGDHPLSSNLNAWARFSTLTDSRPRSINPCIPLRSTALSLIFNSRGLPRCRFFLPERPNAEPGDDRTSCMSSSFSALSKRRIAYFKMFSWSQH